MCRVVGILSALLVSMVGMVLLPGSVLANTLEAQHRAETLTASLPGFNRADQHAGSPVEAGDNAATDNTPSGLVKTCDAAKPGLTLSASSLEGDSATNTVYTVTLTNNDDPACGPSSFDLTVVYLPDGWSGDLSPDKLSLSPGAMGKAFLSVTAANDTLTDKPRLQVAISDSRVPLHARAATPVYADNDMAAGTDSVLGSAVPVEPAGDESLTRINLVGDTGDQVWHDNATIPADDDDRIEHSERLTRRLTGLLSAYNEAGENAKAQALDDLVAAAEERHALLSGLIAEYPGAVLRVAVPARIRVSMPAEARAYIEQRVGINGELEVLYEDYEDGRARLRQYLNSGGERVALHLEADRPDVLSGTRVSTQGVYLKLEDNPEADAAMALASGESILTLAAGGGKKGGSNGGTAVAVQSTLGDQKTLLILVNFQDQPTEPYTAAYAHNVVFDTVGDFFLENSYGQTWLSGDTYGWLTIALDSTVCDIHTLASQADSAAQAAGANLSDYAHIVYAFQNACGGKGIGTVGGNPSRAWINGDLDIRAIAHELGHGLGLWHSHALECGPTTLGTDCAVIEYGDPFDSMSNEDDPGHFNAFQKERLGWINNDVVPAITTVTTSGTYTVAPFETNDTRPKVLKILKATDATTGQRSWYYLEWRQAIGFDAFLAANDRTNALNGLLVHTGTEGNGDSSNLLDLTPASGLVNSWDWADAALVAGESFEDPDAGVILRTDWVNGSEAAVTIFVESNSTDQPADPPADQPSITVSTDHPSYSRNEWVSVTATVSSGGVAVANAAVSFTITRPDGKTITGETTTGSNGAAMYKFRLKKRDPFGNYQAESRTTINALSASDTTSFSVQ